MHQSTADTCRCTVHCGLALVTTAAATTAVAATAVVAITVQNLPLLPLYMTWQTKVINTRSPYRNSPKVGSARHSLHG